MTDPNLERALERAREIVEKWPRWKQNSLLVTAMATSPTPREPIVETRKMSETEDRAQKTNVEIEKQS